MTTTHTQTQWEALTYLFTAVNNIGEDRFKNVNERGCVCKIMLKMFVYFSLKTWKYQFWHKTGSQADLSGFFMWPGFKDMILHTKVLHWVCYCFRWYVNLFCKHLYSEVVWGFWCDVNHVDSMTHKYTLCFFCVCIFFSKIFERCLIHCTAFHYLPGRLFKYWSHIYYTNKKHTAARNHVLKSDVWRSGNLKWDFNHVYQHLERFKVRTGISKGWLKNKNLTKKWNRIFLKAWQMPEIIFWCLVKAMDLLTDVPF